MNIGTKGALRPVCISDSFDKLSSEAVKHKVETHSLVARQPLPVNSIDVVSAALVGGVCVLVLSSHVAIKY